MTRYWTCSKFADWLRGTPHGGAKTAEGWDEWHKAAKAKSAWRYWLADEGLESVEKFIKFIPNKLHSIKYYITIAGLLAPMRLLQILVILSLALGAMLEIVFFPAYLMSYRIL